MKLLANEILAWPYSYITTNTTHLSAHLNVIQSHYSHHSSNTKTKRDPYFSLTTYNLTSSIIFLSNVLSKIGLFLLSCQLSAQLLDMWAVLLLMGNNITCYL